MLPPGQDGINVDMMLVDVLFDVWVLLFEVCTCLEYGMVPSVWKQILVVRVPKKQSRGVCDVNNF